MSIAGRLAFFYYGNGSTPASSVPSDPPSHGLLAEMTAAQKQQKKRNRESYLEAVSTGSVNDIRPSGRVSTEPVDL